MELELLQSEVFRILTMRKLSEVLQQAQSSRVAIGHFNIADLVLLKAVFEAARQLNVPVLVGASEGERDFAGTRQLAALVASLREEGISEPGRKFMKMGQSRRGRSRRRPRRGNSSKRRESISSLPRLEIAIWYA